MDCMCYSSANKLGHYNVIFTDKKLHIRHWPISKLSWFCGRKGLTWRDVSFNLTAITAHCLLFVYWWPVKETIGTPASLACTITYLFHLFRCYQSLYTRQNVGERETCSYSRVAGRDDRWVQKNQMLLLPDRLAGLCSRQARKGAALTTWHLRTNKGKDHFLICNSFACISIL